MDNNLRRTSRTSEDLPVELFDTLRNTRRQSKKGKPHQKENNQYCKNDLAHKSEFRVQELSYVNMVKNLNENYSLVEKQRLEIQGLKQALKQVRLRQKQAADSYSISQAEELQKLRRYEKENAQYIAELQELREAFSSMKCSCEEMVKEQDQVARERQVYRQKHAELLDENEELTVRITALKADECACRRQLQETQKQLSALRKQHGGCQSVLLQRNSLQQRCNEFQRKINQYVFKYNEVQGQFNEVQIKYYRMQRDYDSLKIDKEQVNSKYIGAIRCLDNQRGLNDVKEEQLKKQIKKAEEEYRIGQEQFAKTMQNQLSLAQQQKNQIQSQIVSLRHLLSASQLKCREQDKQVEYFRAMQRRCGQLLDENNRIRSQIDKLIMQKQTLRESLVLDMQKMRKQEHIILQKIDKLQTSISIIQSDKRKCESDRDLLQGELVQTKAKYQLAESSKETLQLQLCNATTKMQVIKSQLQLVQASLVECMSDHEYYQNKQDKLMCQLGQITNCLAIKQCQNNTLQQNNNLHQMEIKSQQCQVQMLRKTIVMLQQQINSKSIAVQNYENVTRKIEQQLNKTLRQNQTLRNSFLNLQQTILRNEQRQKQLVDSQMKVGREFDSSLSILKEENSALQALMSEELEKRKTIIKELMDQKNRLYTLLISRSVGE